MLSESELAEVERLQRVAYGADSRLLTDDEAARLAYLQELRLTPARDHEDRPTATSETAQADEPAPEAPVAGASPSGLRRMIVTSLVAAGLGVAAGIALTLASQSMLFSATPAWALQQQGTAQELSRSYEFVAATQKWDDPAVIAAASASDDVIAWSGTMNGGSDYCVAFHDLPRSTIELECQKADTDAYPLSFEWNDAERSRTIRVNVDRGGGLQSSDLPTG